MAYIYAILIGLITILLPWGRSINSIFIVILLVFWIFSFNWKEKWNNIKHYKFEILPLFIYFVIHLFGLLYSQDIQEGYSDVLKKTSFIIIPIIISSIYPLIDKYIEIIKKLFIFSLLIYFITSLFTAYNSYLLGNKLAFYYIHLIQFNKMHPSYISIYLILGLAFVFEFSLTISKYYLLLVPIFICNILLLSARTEIFILFIVLIIFIYFIYKKNKNLKLLIFSVSIIFISSLFSIKYLPELNTRFSVLIKGEKTDRNTLEFKNERSELWKYAMYSIKNKPFLGIGTGASHKFYKDYFKSLNKSFATTDKLNNTHNQFLQQLLVLGITGFVVCLYLYLYLFYKSLYYNNIVVIVLSITFIISSITECILETQSGIVFISLFYSLSLINLKYNKEKAII